MEIRNSIINDILDLESLNQIKKSKKKTIILQVKLSSGMLVQIHKFANATAAVKTKLAVSMLSPHPNIVNVLQYAFDDRAREYYMITEPLDYSLRQWVQREEHVSSVGELSLQLLRVLDYLHEKKITLGLLNADTTFVCVINKSPVLKLCCLGYWHVALNEDSKYYQSDIYSAGKAIDFMLRSFKNPPETTELATLAHRMTTRYQQLPPLTVKDLLENFPLTAEQNSLWKRLFCNII